MKDCIEYYKNKIKELESEKKLNKGQKRKMINDELQMIIKAFVLRGRINKIN